MANKTMKRMRSEEDITYLIDVECSLDGCVKKEELDEILENYAPYSYFNGSINSGFWASENYLYSLTVIKAAYENADENTITTIKTYIQSEVLPDALASIAESYYNKEEVDSYISEVNTKFDSYVLTSTLESDYYTKTEVDEKISEVESPKYYMHCISIGCLSPDDPQTYPFFLGINATFISTSSDALDFTYSASILNPNMLLSKLPNYETGTYLNVSYVATTNSNSPYKPIGLAYEEYSGQRIICLIAYNSDSQTTVMLRLREIGNPIDTVFEIA